MSYSTDEIRILEDNPYIRMASPLTFVMKNELCKELFRKWKAEGNCREIREELCRHGIPNDLISERYVSAVEWGFQRDLSMLYGVSLSNRACDIALVASGLFTAQKQKVVWDPKFKRSLLEGFPGVSIEEGIIQAGLTIEMVGTQRITALRHI